MTRLTCYRVNGGTPRMRPAPMERDWMEATPQSFAYRCLPLNIANACGWELLCTAGFEAWWDGGMALESIRVVPEETAAHELPISHFGSGILTFHVTGLFRTAPGFSLLSTGPFNRPKDGIAPLTGIVETDWAPYTFTMNWRFTRKDTVVRFRRDEPFAVVLPIDLAAIEAVHPDLRPMADEPGLEAAFKGWSEGRASFNADLKAEGSEARKKGWQKDYFKGLDAEGRPVTSHRTRLRLHPFAESKPTLGKGVPLDVKPPKGPGTP